MQETRVLTVEHLCCAGGQRALRYNTTHWQVERLCCSVVSEDSMSMWLVSAAGENSEGAWHDPWDSERRGHRLKIR